MLTRGPINVGKIPRSERTRFFLRITVHFELLNFELVSLDYTWIWLDILNSKYFLRVGMIKNFRRGTYGDVRIVHPCKICACPAGIVSLIIIVHKLVPNWMSV